jgi:tRNA (cmo5U34)-methyltransferase
MADWRDAAPRADWRDPEKAESYLKRIGLSAPRLAGEAMLVEVLPAAPRRVLDLGCGDGRLAALVLRERSSVEQVVLIDRSPPMLAAARERFAGDRRADIREGDLTAPLDLDGTFDVVVSGFAIHHVDHARKRALLGEIAALLTPGGLFANLEVVASATPELHAAFRRAIGREEDDPDDQLAGVEEQLVWMRAAGLEQVDCLWRWRGFALLVGERPVS